MNGTECRCYEIVEQIDTDFPNSDWNMDEACEAWSKRSVVLVSVDHDFEEDSDAQYACTCPTCGRIVCGWCV